LKYNVIERVNKNNDQIWKICTVCFRSGEKFNLRLIMANIVIRMTDNNKKVKIVSTKKDNEVNNQVVQYLSDNCIQSILLNFT
jgi:hypothetical protein